MVFQTPPEAAATYQVLGLTGSTAMSFTRPDINAGPIPRSFNPAKSTSFFSSPGEASPDSCAEPPTAVACNRISPATIRTPTRRLISIIPAPHTSRSRRRPVVPAAFLTGSLF